MLSGIVWEAGRPELAERHSTQKGVFETLSLMPQGPAQSKVPVVVIESLRENSL